MKTQEFKGKQFLVTRGITHPEYSYHTFEREENDFREMYWNVKDGDVVIDVGASYGSYSLTATAMGAQVYAFEPEPSVFDDLKKSIALNGWQDRCQAFNVGLWDKAEDDVAMLSYAPHWPAQTITAPFKMRTLDMVVEELKLERLDWLKIDVEGAEEKVLKGAEQTILRFKPKLIVECHIFLDHDISIRVRNILMAYGYQGFAAIDRPPCVMLLT